MTHFTLVHLAFAAIFITCLVKSCLLQDGPEELILKINASPKKLDLGKPSRSPETKPSAPKDHWVDKCSRILFPTFYALFLMAYVIHYKSKE